MNQMKSFILYLDIFWVAITCYSLGIKSTKSTCYGVAHSPERKTDLQNLHILFAYTHTHTQWQRRGGSEGWWKTALEIVLILIVKGLTCLLWHDRINKASF